MLDLWFVLESEVFVLGLLICRRLQDGLISCRTDISDHLLGGYMVNCGREHSFRSFAFLQKVDNFSFVCPVFLFSCFVSEIRERFP